MKSDRGGISAKGIHVTCFIVVNWKHDWSKYREVFTKGHEIGSRILGMVRLFISCGRLQIKRQLCTSWSGMVVPEMENLVIH